MNSTNDPYFSSPLVTHISTEKGFWCINDEQSVGLCADFEVRFCCPKYQHGSCNEEGWDWTQWVNGDTPDGTGDWEMIVRDGQIGTSTVFRTSYYKKGFKRSF